MPLHPDAEAFLDARAAAAGKAMEDNTPEGVRAARRRWIAGLPPRHGLEPHLVEDFAIPGPAGPVAARRYVPRPSTLPGTVVYLHGGGWILGDLEEFDRLCRALALESGCEVISVDYRLAPEHRFPAGLEDAWAAVRWAGARHPGRPLVVAGDSAGGNLAAVCAIRARDAGGPRIALQLLVYPVTDCDPTHGSFHDGSGHPWGTFAGMEWCWNHYCEPHERANPLASPMKTPSLAGLPPAHFVMVREDCLRDDGLVYAARLGAAGVPVGIDMHEDMFHGFFAVPQIFPAADAAIARAGRAIAAAVTHRSP